jgi:hypothetical protein
VTWRFWKKVSSTHTHTKRNKAERKKRRPNDCHESKTALQSSFCFVRLVAKHFSTKRSPLAWMHKCPYHHIGILEEIKNVKEIDTTSLDRTREKERLMSFGRKENVSNSYRILHYVDKNNCSLSEKQSITRQINKVPMRSTHPDCQSSKQQCPVASQRRERTQGSMTEAQLCCFIGSRHLALRLETCDGLMRWIRQSQVRAREPRIPTLRFAWSPWSTQQAFSTVPYCFSNMHKSMRAAIEDSSKG